MNELAPVPDQAAYANHVRSAFEHEQGKAAAERAFIDQALKDVVADELSETTAKALAAGLADFWRFAETVAPGAQAVRIVPLAESAGLDRLEIVQDDRPFLVDSVMGEVADQGLTVKAMFHPVVEISGRRRSTIQVIVERIGEDRAGRLTRGIEATLADVRVAVEDFPALLLMMREAIKGLAARAELDAEAHEENLAFLRWLEDGHFVFLGARVYDYPRTKDGGYAAEEPLYQPQGSLGVLRDPERHVLRRAHEPALLTKELAGVLERAPEVQVAKSNLRSRVHRRAYMDYVGIRRFGPDGKPMGEIRFVGLFTADAYDEPARDVPLIRRKLARVLAAAGVGDVGHDAKRLKNILEQHPRDELFQASEQELVGFALGMLHLYDRPRVRLFVRHDPFGRFVSALLFVPRDRYDSELRRKAGDILAAAFGGHVSAFYPAFPETALTRVHFIIGVAAGAGLTPDLAQVEAEIAEAARTWEDRFEAAVRTEHPDPAALIARTRGAFPAGYRDRYGAAEALTDIEEIERLAPGQTLQVRAFRTVEDTSLSMRFKLYRPGEPPALARVLPILERMGLTATAEFGFPITLAGEGAVPVHVHEFMVEDERGEHLVFSDLKTAFEEAFEAVWQGLAENDGFNRLVLELGISWREAALIRALARCRQQSGLDPSQAVQEQALSDHPAIARLILGLFHARFDPARPLTLAERAHLATGIEAEIVAALQEVASLDADRALRRLAKLVSAITRTNFYQPGEDGAPKPYISFKTASREIVELPAPKPFREIFVASPQVEGVHLRFGPVARGGLRWSDRRDDFRTEVLGLAKAQQVKNAVIVPVGSKGGFYPKRLPKGAAPEAIRAEGVAAYRTFLSGLLDLTDNLAADGAVIHPAAVVAHDADDPYLVVAADKGTATFSDIANGLAEDYGFWLGDAFASGGSVGYDHKAMGITARGAWEAVKRHFREMGKDIQAEPFTVVGVGDMSGDVFGNGMLLSKETKLIAAFDHRHIFIDPDPAPARSWLERERLFALPRSSWDDYDKAQISEGGGVYPRTLKSITLSPQAKAALGFDADEATPAEIVTAILRAPAELLYLGGIGTYVKATSEDHADAGDKTNDPVRIDGRDLRVKVVGEGANLGFTQAGRIEFARAGGRIDTDAIDNSAGVDCSDHEVNIKILTGMLEREGRLTREARDELLRSMTDEVAERVLAHNYAQTLALSLSEVDAAAELKDHAAFMGELEAEGRLDRALEGLPDAAAIAERTVARTGLTRPELAVLRAYAKLDASDAIVASDGPDDPALDSVLTDYFPTALHAYGEAIARHRLRREIVTTVVANDMVDRCGPTFARRLKAASGAGDAALVTGYAAAKRILGLDPLWQAVAGLDGKIPARDQLTLFQALATALRGQTYWLARRAQLGRQSIGELIERYAEPFQALEKVTPGLLSPLERADYQSRLEQLAATGAPRELAERIAVLRPLTTAADLVDLAATCDWPLEAEARLYHAVGAAFGFDRLRAAAVNVATSDTFERTAVRRLMEELIAEQASLAEAVVRQAGEVAAGETDEAVQAAIAAWRKGRLAAAQLAERTIAEIEAAGGGWSFAKLTIANSALRELAAGARRGGRRAA